MDIAIEFGRTPNRGLVRGASVSNAAGKQPAAGQHATEGSNELGMMNGTMQPGAMPAKVSESDRAMVTAGFAKEVEAVNQ